MKVPSWNEKTEWKGRRNKAIQNMFEGEQEICHTWIDCTATGYCWFIFQSNIETKQILLVLYRYEDGDITVPSNTFLFHLYETYIS